MELVGCITKYLPPPKPPFEYWSHRPHFRDYIIHCALRTLLLSIFIPCAEKELCLRPALTIRGILKLMYMK